MFPMISVCVSQDFRLCFPCLPFVQIKVSYVFCSIINVDCPVTIVKSVIMLIFVSDYVTEVMEIPREQPNCHNKFEDEEIWRQYCNPLFWWPPRKEICILLSVYDTNLNLGLTDSHTVDQLLDNMGHFRGFFASTCGRTCNYLWVNCAHVTISICHV